MGRHPSNGAPSFRFHPAEVAQMDSILQKYEGHVPPRDFLMALAQSFSDSPERAGKSVVQMKQVWNWFQNRRFALRAKVVKSPGKPITSSVIRDEVTPVRYILPVPQQTAHSSGSHVVRNTSEPPPMEFEAKSARDGAWYDVQEFLSHRYLETGNPEVLVHFSGFGLGEDEWVNIRKHVRQRSLPCEASECIAVLNGDLILCFQEGKEQALYFDAHVLDAQRRRHDVRGCRCRFLVRFDHDQSEEIVPLRKMCRRPETDHRLQQLHAANEAAASSSVSMRPSIGTSTSSPSSLPTPSSIGPPTPPPIGIPTSFPIRAPTPSPIRPPTPVPTSVSPAPLTVCTQTSAPVPVLMKAENNNPAQIPVHASKKVDSDNQAQIPNPQAESSKTDADNPGLVLGTYKVETAPVAVLVPEPIKIKIEADNSALLPERNKVTAPVQVLVPEPNKIGTGMPTPLPERNRIETECQDPASIPKPVRVENESPDPLSNLIKVNSINPGPSASQTFAQANFTGPVHVNKHLQARKFRGMVDSISVRPSAAQNGARPNFTGPIDVNKLLESKKAEIVVLTGRK